MMHAAIVERRVDDMTTRLTSLADASRDHADMYVSMAKTFTQHVHRRDDKSMVTEAANLKQRVQ